MSLARVARGTHKVTRWMCLLVDQYSFPGSGKDKLRSTFSALRTNLYTRGTVGQNDLLCSSLMSCQLQFNLISFVCLDGVSGKTGLGSCTRGLTARRSPISCYLSSHQVSLALLQCAHQIFYLVVVERLASSNDPQNYGVRKLVLLVGPHMVHTSEVMNPTNRNPDTMAELAEEDT